LALPPLEAVVVVTVVTDLELMLVGLADLVVVVLLQPQAVLERLGKVTQAELEEALHLSPLQEEAVVAQEV
jgi:acyl CoA:acetate/3-ketoacid CoA transferase beta subunit